MVAQREEEKEDNNSNNNKNNKSNGHAAPQTTTPPPTSSSSSERRTSISIASKNCLPSIATTHPTNTAAITPIPSPPPRFATPLSPPHFCFSTEDFLLDLNKCTEERKKNGFKQNFLKHWKNAAAKGTLNYCTEKTSKFRELDGRFKFSLQLNEDRCKKRRKPLQFVDICEPFNENCWNFMKLKPEECLFHWAGAKNVVATADSIENSPENGVLAVNASPLCVGHSLLIPSPQKRLIQVLNVEAIKMSIELMLLVEDPQFIVICNGLMAHASVNHLHLQTIFWPSRSGIMALDFEQIVLTPTASPELFLLQRPTWYLPAFVFQLRDIQKIALVAKTVEKVVQFLISNGVAHNLFMCRAAEININNLKRMNENGLKQNDENVKNEVKNVANELVTLFLFPRKASTESLNSESSYVSTFVPAAVELAGILAVYDQKFFDSATEAKIIELFEERELMTDKDFQKLACSLVESGVLDFEKETEGKKSGDILYEYHMAQASASLERMKMADEISIAAEEYSEGKKTGKYPEPSEAEKKIYKLVTAPIVASIEATAKRVHEMFELWRKRNETVHGPV